MGERLKFNAAVVYLQRQDDGASQNLAQLVHSITAYHTSAPQIALDNAKAYLNASVEYCNSLQASVPTEKDALAQTCTQFITGYLNQEYAHTMRDARKSLMVDYLDAQLETADPESVYSLFLLNAKAILMRELEHQTARAPAKPRMYIYALQEVEHTPLPPAARQTVRIVKAFMAGELHIESAAAVPSADMARAG